MGVRPARVRRPLVPPELAARLPPGQHPTKRWPVLHYGEIPAFDPQTWDFSVSGEVESPLRFSWDAFHALPRVTISGDLHCVTRWSKLDNAWQGVSAREIAARAGVTERARYLVLVGDGGYSANLPIAALDDGVLLAMAHDGEALSPEHGAPLRAVIPSRYAWKSVKWLRAIEFLAEDRSGFWEEYGYHDNADPWREERFAG